MGLLLLQSLLDRIHISYIVAVKKTNDSVNKVLLVNIQLLLIVSKYLQTMPLTRQTLANTVINSSSNTVIEHNFLSRQNDKNTPVWSFGLKPAKTLDLARWRTCFSGLWASILRRSVKGRCGRSVGGPSEAETE